MIDVAFSNPADRIIAQGRALVHAIESLTTIEPTGPLERLLTGLLLSAYERQYLGRCTNVSPKDGPDE